MLSPFVQAEPSSVYLNCVEREEELDRLGNQAKNRKSMLLYGVEGVGKSRLLRTFAAGQPLALHVAHTHSPREFLLALLQALHSANEELKFPERVESFSSSSLKGIAHRALDTRSFLMVLDHVDGPSRVLTGMIKDLHFFGRTPVIFASRLPHMEDIGALRSLCALKSERVEIKNWSQTIALEFAQRHAEAIQLRASNLDSILSSLVAWSDGNPGAILQMLEMAQLPQYRVDEQIKAHILYVDYRMGDSRRPQKQEGTKNGPLAL